VAVGKYARAPLRGRSSARAAINYILGEELTLKTTHAFARDNPLTVEQRGELRSVKDEARMRPDLGAKEPWRPVNGELTGRPSMVWSRGIVSIATAAEEMEALYRTNPRVRDPVRHCIIGISPEESGRLSDEQLIAFANRVVDDAGWTGHAAVFAVHRDEPHAHVHVILASVSSETLRPYNRLHDDWRLSKAMRETELAFGMEAGKGLYIIRDHGLPTQRVAKASASDWALHRSKRAYDRLHAQMHNPLEDSEGLESPEDRRDRLVHAIRTYLDGCDRRGETPLRADVHCLAANLATIIERAPDGQLAMRVLKRAEKGTTIVAEGRNEFGEPITQYARWLSTSTVVPMRSEWIAPSAVDAAGNGTQVEQLDHVVALRRRAWLDDLGDLDRATDEARQVIEEDPGRISRDLIASGHATFFDEDIDRWVLDRVEDAAWLQLSDAAIRGNKTLKGLSYDGEQALYTTHEQLELERDVVASAMRLAQQPDPQFNRAALEQAIAEEQTALGLTFSREQVAAFELLEHRFGLLHGNAGSAKSTLMAVVRRYADLTNRDVSGYATSQLAAESLGNSSGIKSLNTARARVIEAAGGDAVVHPGSIVVVDEVSMISLDALQALQQRCEERGATLLAIGDEAQLPTIEAGNTMRVLRAPAEEAGAYHQVKLSYRQSEGSEVEWMRSAVPRGAAAIRRQDPAAFGVYVQEFITRGHVLFHDTRKAEVEAKAADIIDASKRGVRVLAPGFSHQDALYTNRAIRSALGLEGNGVRFRLERGARELAIGDRVQFTKNADKTLGVLNGYLGTVHSVEPKNVRVELDGGTVVNVDPARYPWLEYGWAVTTHKAQGRGDPMVIATLGKSDDARSAHVALTRCQNALHIHTRLDKTQLLERLCSPASLEPKTSALLYDEMVRRTGGPDTPFAKAVRRALDDATDPLRQMWVTEMRALQAEQNRAVRDILARSAEATARTLSLPERQRDKEAARIRRGQHADVDAAVTEYRQQPFLAWTAEHRREVEREAERRELRECYDREAANRREEAQRRDVARGAPTPVQLERLATALRGCVSIESSAGEAYLRGRGLEAPFGDVLFAESWYKGVLRDDGRPSRGLGPAVVFPVRDATGNVVAAQGRLLEALPARSEDEKALRMLTVGAVAGGVFATAGAFAADTCAIVEAPIDAITLQQCGLEAIALCGAQNRPEWLREALIAKEVIIATDADLAGERAAREISKWLSDDSTLARLRLPDGIKDANELLQRDRDALRASVEIARNEAIFTLQRAWRRAWRESFDIEPPCGLFAVREMDAIGQSMLDRALELEQSPIEAEVARRVEQDPDIQSPRKGVGMRY